MKIFFFGDSITEGQFVGLPYRWVDIVANNLTKRVNTNFEAGRCFVGANSGDTTAMGMARFAWQVQQIEPEILFIQFGLNDCNVWASDRGMSRTSEGAFVANLKEMIDRGRNFGAKHVILSNNHQTAKSDDFGVMGTFESRNQIYNNLIAQVANERNVILNDIYASFMDRFETPSEYLLADEIHLNRVGHEFYADRIMKILFKIK
jgi:lysophospholipase L1-like esterase